MFYIQKEIQDHLICNICDELFDDPRVLPCGHTYCNDCLASLANNKDNRMMIACPRSCAEYQLPDSGFPINRAIGDLVQVKAGEVIQSSQVRELKSKLRLIDSKCQEIERRLQIGSDEIKEECMSLRNQIDLSVETTEPDQIKYDYAHLIKQVDEYEIDCISYYEQISKRLCDKLRAFLTTVATFHSDAVQTLSQYVIKDDQVEKLIKSSDEMLALIQNKELLVQRKKHNYKLTIFEPSSFESPCVSLIKRQDLSIEATQVHTMREKERSFSTLEQVTYSNTNQKIFYAYENTLHSRVVIVFNQNLESSQSLDCKYSAELYFPGDFTSFLHVNDYYIWVMQLNDNKYSRFNFSRKSYSLDTKSKLFLIKTDKSGKYINHAGFGIDTQLLAANSSHIFFFDQQCQVILGCSPHNLKPSKPCFSQIPAEQCKAMQASDKCIFLLHQVSDEMKLLAIPLDQELTTWPEVTMPSLNYNQIKLISPNYLVAFDNTTNSFCSIHTETLVIRNIVQDMKMVKTGLTMNQDNTDKVILYDTHQLRAHFSVLDHRFFDDL